MSFHQQQQEKQEGNLSVASGNNNGVNLSNMPSAEGAVSDSRSPSHHNNNNNNDNDKDKYFRDENHHRVLWMGDVSRHLTDCYNNHSLTLSLVFNRLMRT